MMAPVHRIDGRGAKASDGVVRIDPVKSLWNGLMIGGTIAAPFFATPGAVLFFLISTYVSLLLGHSVGMHRLMIHRSWDAQKWLERSLIYLGTLVGIGGPAQIIRVHDIRDWAQRQAHCHDYFSHRRHYWRDVNWQLFYRFDFVHPPRVIIEDRWISDPVYAHLNRYWRVHQIALASLLFGIGGWAWLVWGVCARVAISTIGHWSVTHICHRPERQKQPGRYGVIGAGVQAADWPGRLTGLITHGECWHSNHHAFPESARIGLESGQLDPGARVIERFAKWGWAMRVSGPRTVDQWDDLIERGTVKTGQEKTRA
jgi:stearoyl-CoA desaturase (delta-9 desaturase)